MHKNGEMAAITLLASLRSEGEIIVWSYNGVLDEVSKTETLELLHNGACRMVVCTDTFRLGMNIVRVPRVVIWKLDTKLGISVLQTTQISRVCSTDQHQALEVQKVIEHIV